MKHAGPRQVRALVLNGPIGMSQRQSTDFEFVELPS